MVKSFWVHASPQSTVTTACDESFTYELHSFPTSISYFLDFTSEDKDRDFALTSYDDSIVRKRILGMQVTVYWWMHNFIVLYDNINYNCQTHRDKEKRFADTFFFCLAKGKHEQVLKYVNYAVVCSFADTAVATFIGFSKRKRKSDTISWTDNFSRKHIAQKYGY